MTEERREKVRIRKSFVALYNYTLDGVKKFWDETHIRNISEKGILITTIRAFQIGDVINVFIKVPTRPFEWIEFKIKVVESPELRTIFDESVAGMHITRGEFIDLQESQKELPREYVAWFLSQKEAGYDELHRPG